jgi:hypothetical protein
VHGIRSRKTQKKIKKRKLPEQTMKKEQREGKIGMKRKATTMKMVC